MFNPPLHWTIVCSPKIEPGSQEWESCMIPLYTIPVKARNFSVYLKDQKDHVCFNWFLLKFKILYISPNPYDLIPDLLLWATNILIIILYVAICMFNHKYTYRIRILLGKFKRIFLRTHSSLILKIQLITSCYLVAYNKSFHNRLICDGA